MYLVIGNGKTGSEVIKRIPENQLLEVCDSKHLPTLDLMKKATCVIVFIPAQAFEEMKSLFIESNVPMVIGTTGVSFEGIQVSAPWIVGSNFSLGVNVLIKLIRGMSQLNSQDLIQKVQIYEEHHIHKKDKPSGTALYLKSLFPKHSVDIEAHRKNDVKGFHSVTLDLEGETIHLEHTALDRGIFAKGALFAASKIEGLSPGIYRFEEMF